MGGRGYRMSFTSGGGGPRGMPGVFFELGGGMGMPGMMGGMMGGTNNGKGRGPPKAPSPPHAIPNGTSVVIRGLTRSQEYNGRSGRINGWDAAKGRYEVEIDDGD